LELASGLEIQKAIAYLREDNFPKVRKKLEKVIQIMQMFSFQAIATLKEFEKAEAKLASAGLRDKEKYISRFNYYYF